MVNWTSWLPSLPNPSEYISSTSDSEDLDGRWQAQEQHQHLPEEDLPGELDFYSTNPIVDTNFLVQNHHPSNGPPPRGAGQGQPLHHQLHQGHQTTTTQHVVHHVVYHHHHSSGPGTSSGGLSSSHAVAGPPHAPLTMREAIQQQRLQRHQEGSAMMRMMNHSDHDNLHGEVDAEVDHGTSASVTSSALLTSKNNFEDHASDYLPSESGNIDPSEAGEEDHGSSVVNESNFGDEESASHQPFQGVTVQNDHTHSDYSGEPTTSNSEEQLTSSQSEEQEESSTTSDEQAELLGQQQMMTGGAPGVVAIKMQKMGQSLLQTFQKNKSRSKNMRNEGEALIPAIPTKHLREPQEPAQAKSKKKKSRSSSTVVSTTQEIVHKSDDNLRHSGLLEYVGSQLEKGATATKKNKKQENKTAGTSIGSGRASSSTAGDGLKSGAGTTSATTSNKRPSARAAKEETGSFLDDVLAFTGFRVEAVDTNKDHPEWGFGINRGETDNKRLSQMPNKMSPKKKKKAKAKAEVDRGAYSYRSSRASSQPLSEMKKSDLAMPLQQNDGSGEGMNQTESSHFADQQNEQSEDDVPFAPFQPSQSSMLRDHSSSQQSHGSMHEGTSTAFGFGAAPQPKVATSTTAGAFGAALVNSNAGGGSGAPSPKRSFFTGRSGPGGFQTGNLTNNSATVGKIDTGATTNMMSVEDTPFVLPAQYTNPSQTPNSTPATRSNKNPVLSSSNVVRGGLTNKMFAHNNYAGMDQVIPGAGTTHASDRSGINSVAGKHQKAPNLQKHISTQQQQQPSSFAEILLQDVYGVPELQDLHDDETDTTVLGNKNTITMHQNFRKTRYKPGSLNYRIFGQAKLKRTGFCLLVVMFFIYVIPVVFLLFIRFFGPEALRVRVSAD
ncbi:unnamed protein product [Amoebophrya sp. A120]|nr:unnamed protein product [Amoebophrya sp. A120]|eukprot:GSA120T00023487001.1